MEKTCFVVMPFSQTTTSHTEKYWDDFFENVKYIMSSLGYECERSEVGPYSLFNNIVTQIENSDLVIAVLTDFNPNVWYELGLRHTLKNGTIMLLEEGQTVPFDIKNFGIVFYNDSFNFHKELKDKIESYISKINPDTIDSPILAALGTKYQKEVEKENVEYRSFIKGLNETGFFDAMRKMCLVEEAQLPPSKKILCLDEQGDINNLIRYALKNQSVIFDTTCCSNEATQRYTSDKYDAVIIDIDSEEKINNILPFLNNIKHLKQRSYIILYGDTNIAHKHSRLLFNSLVTAYTNQYLNVVKLLQDIIDGKQYT